MPQGRPDIPSDLKRALMVEAGHRCAIPTCRAVAPLEFEHIVDWSKTGKHEFDNMIVLCASCHGLKVEGADAGKLDRKALRQYKANLRIIGGRYGGGIERHILEYFALDPNSAPIQLTFGQKFMITYLLHDGLLAPVNGVGEIVIGDPTKPEIRVMQSYGLTDSGRQFVEKWITAAPLPDSGEPEISGDSGGEPNPAKPDS
jgi:hypothetical protein